MEGTPHVCFPVLAPPQKKHTYVEFITNEVTFCSLSSATQRRAVNTTPCSRRMPHFRCSRNANIVVLDFLASTAPLRAWSKYGFSRFRGQWLTGRGCPGPPFGCPSATSAMWTEAICLRCTSDRTCHISTVCPMKERTVCVNRLPARSALSACALSPALGYALASGSPKCYIAFTVPGMGSTVAICIMLPPHSKNVVRSIAGPGAFRVFISHNPKTCMR